MIYCVVPRPLADELYPKLVEHYRDEENVTVIVDRREFDRRARYGRSGTPRLPTAHSDASCATAAGRASPGTSLPSHASEPRARRSRAS